MRAEEMAAERAREVRDAARAWRGAGFIGDEGLSRILLSYPDDRRRFGIGFRTLAFVFTSVAVWSIVGLSFTFFGHGADRSAAFLLLWALMLALLTELQRGPWRRADAGAESASALASTLLTVIGVLSLRESSPPSFAVLFLSSTFVACSLATWRWGDFLFPLGAAVSGFGLLTQTPFGRILWIVAALALLPACLAASRGGRLAPSHRRAAMIVGVVALLALYAAFHIWSWDQRVIESMRGAAPGPLAYRFVSILVTAILPPLLLLLGWRRREPLLLHGGLLLLGVSIATIRLYHEVMPLFLALILIGAFCLALAIGFRRWLRSGEEGERFGFTADPLLDNTNRTEVIRSVVAMASFTPAAEPTPGSSRFQGGGGSFGGSGATGAY